MISNTCKNSLRRIATNEGKPIKGFNAIPGPKPLPILGNLWRYLPIIGDYSFRTINLTYGKMHEQYGPIVKEKVFGDRTLVHLFDPVDMIEIYSSEKKPPIRISHRALGKYRLERPHLYNGPGLFPSNGVEWRRIRSLFNPILYTTEAPAKYSAALEDVTDDLIARIPAFLDNKMEMDIQPLLLNWALECIGTITLNRRLGYLSTDGNQEALSIQEAVSDTLMAVFISENIPFAFRSYKKLEAAQDILSGVVEKYFNQAIEDSKSGANSDSLVSRMLQLENADKKDVFTMILDMFLAGIDTTANTLAFGLYHLAMNKKVQDNMREDLKKGLPSRNSRMTGSRHRFMYMKAALHETFRMNPASIGTGRITEKDLILSGYYVPAQSFVILQHQVASMLKEYYPNPHLFEPERWIRREKAFIVSSPFGYALRMCIGTHLATRILHLGLAKMIRNFDISYHYDKIGSYNRLINVPDKPLRLRIKEVNE